MLVENFVDGFAFPSNQMPVGAIRTLGSVMDLAEFAAVAPSDPDDGLRNLGCDLCSRTPCAGLALRAAGGRSPRFVVDHGPGWRLARRGSLARR